MNKEEKEQARKEQHKHEDKQDDSTEESEHSPSPNLGKTSGSASSRSLQGTTSQRTSMLKSRSGKGSAEDHNGPRKRTWQEPSANDIAQQQGKEQGPAQQ